MMMMIGFWFRQNKDIHLHLHFSTFSFFYSTPKWSFLNSHHFCSLLLLSLIFVSYLNAHIVMFSSYEKLRPGHDSRMESILQLLLISNNNICKFITTKPTSHHISMTIQNATTCTNDEILQGHFYHNNIKWLSMYGDLNRPTTKNLLNPIQLATENIIHPILIRVYLFLPKTGIQRKYKMSIKICDYTPFLD